MEIYEIIAVLLAGVGAGAINAAVGSGTLITFPALVAFGVPPVTATMSNAIGLIPGGIASSFGYREEIRGQGRRLLKLVPASLLGSLVGAFLLLNLPDDTFESIVPILIVLALVLVVFQPMVQRFLRRKKTAEIAEVAEVAPASAGMGLLSPGRWTLVTLIVLLTAIYGGYFAAAQGIILVGLLGLVLPDSLQRINGAKNVLVLVVNITSATVYTIVGFDRIHWLAVLLIAIGSLFGGYFGARVARKLSPVLLRVIIVALGLVAFWRILAL
ncbi:sulfite exporter TauE/SafE family protein [Brevibacterium jeotgali]|uniref:Probable membrane transporter protein n=1 Tax=Brevibacterium jeotgali TaxID=1262550 RepID=A0A2H1L1X8_9MICO|nr:sulfite exporter TauE/SafE family protein [Brevibacterium jeotgali]TWC02876.1 hypothetical protein FB108_1579 [Brevibacterium jeotgali]SMY10898.1 hypothetical protein BJEO58_00474 [Brevibacterium jeotgali]